MAATITILNNECKRAIQRALDKITDLREKIEDGKVTRPEHISSELLNIGKSVEAVAWYVPTEGHCGEAKCHNTDI
jgi:histidinol dehydrogenase